MAHHPPHKDKPPIYISQFKALTALLVVIILAPGYFMLIKPVYTAFADAQQLSSTYQQQWDLNQSQLKNYQRTIDVYQSVNPLEESKVNQILPDKVDEANLYVNLESLAASTNLALELVDITPLAASTKKALFAEEEELTGSAVSLINVKLDLSDVSYAKLKSILTLIENNLRLLDVTSMDFNAADGSLSLTLQAYYLKSNI